jgi:ABC-2 type transport system ATP-binding protein
VNLTLNEGEIYGLLGPNGAGKSTTIAAALGLVRASGGTVRVLGADPRADAKAIHGRLGVLPEQNGFYGWMTARDYLRFFSRLYGRERGDRDLAARLAQVGLEPHAGQPIGTFSQGMRQRLGLARALIGIPELLILDEPTNGLDPRGRREVHDILLDLSANRGIGILLCTHLLDDVDRLCKRIGIIVAGRTVVEGSVDDLLRTNQQMARFQLGLGGDLPGAESFPEGISFIARNGDWCIVGIDPTLSPDVAWRELLFRGWPLTEIRREGGGLESLYLVLTERSSS